MKRVLSVVFNSFLHDSRVLKESLSLQQAGYEVRVIALHSGDLPEEEVVAGVPVQRLRLRTRSWSKNRFIQLFKYAEVWAKLIRLSRKADILHCNDIEPLPLCLLTKWLFNRRLKVVYDAHELEFDKSDTHTNYYPRFFLRLAERFFIRHADAMIVVSPLIADAYVQRYGIRPPAVVMNCPYYREPGPHEDIFRKKFGIPADHKIFLYQGVLQPHRGLELLTELFSEMEEPYVLVVLGYGPLAEMVEETASRQAKIFYHPAVPPTALDDYTRCGDFGFYLIQGNTTHQQLTLGNKVFQYIMAGLPVVSSDLTSMRYILKDGMGVLVKNFRDKEEVRKALLELGSWGKAHYQPILAKAATQYTWENQEKVLLQAYQSMYER